MGRIFLSAGHGGMEGSFQDPGAVVAGTTEAQEMILLRDLIVPIVRSQGFEILAVPDDLNLRQSIDWINSRARTGDVALEIHADAFGNTSVRGASIFHIANNEERKGHAELVLLNLLTRVPQLPSRGAKPDTATGVGSLGFCRQVIPPSLLMEVGFLTNPDDRFILQNQRRDLALGIADGLMAWSRAVDNLTASPATTTPAAAPPPSTPSNSIAAPAPTSSVYAGINIRLNGANYPEQGLIISGNAFIPVDLVDRLGVDISRDTTMRRVSYRNVVYIKAIDLRNYNIAVSWDNPSRTVILRSVLQICPGQLDRIMGHGNTTEVQLIVFLEGRNPNAFARFPGLPKIYREEAATEGVNYDIAFCQMCLETGFLNFGGDVRPEQNNFAGLGAVGGGAAGATFPSARIGVRAQIQHLKAYASTEPLVQDLVDPRFRFVARGVAPLIDQLSGRWAADLEYGKKITAILRQLYESAQLL